MVVTWGQRYNVGEKPTVILYTSYINRHAVHQESLDKRHDELGLQLNLLLTWYIFWSRIGWVSMKEMFKSSWIDVERIMENRSITIPTVHTYKYQVAIMVYRYKLRQLCRVIYNNIRSMFVSDSHYYYIYLIHNNM